MRILYFTRDYTPHDFRFLNAILDNGLEVYYMRPGKHRDFEVRPLPAGVHMVDWKFGMGSEDMLTHEEETTAELKRLFAELEIDVVHSGPLTDTSYLVTKAGLHPHVAMSWGFDLGREIHTSPEAKERARIALSGADWFLGDCFMELDTAEQLGYERSRSEIFPWGIDTERFAPLSKKTDDHFRVLSLRSMEANYSVETVVRAFLRAAAQNPVLELLLLGDGTQMPRLRQIAAADSNGTRIHFLGRQPNDALIDYYHLADLYVSASVVDGSSVSLLEAMGCGVPVLMSDIPGNREWVTEGESGMFFPVKDEKALSEKILYAAAHPAEMKQISENARKVILERADWNKNKRKIMDAYQGAIAQCKQR